MIDPELCIACGKCFEVCRYGAISVGEEAYSIDEISCEGCGYCARVCPDQAITNVKQNVGSWYVSRIRTGSSMVHARLKIGADNSGKLVARVKNEAKQIARKSGKPIVLVDGSPGTGCPVVSSLTGAALVVLVTEPTRSGLHDLIRVYELVKMFGIKAACIVNKADLNAEVLAELRSFLDRESIVNLAEIPYDEAFTAAITNGVTIVEWDSARKQTLDECWTAIRKLVLT